MFTHTHTHTHKTDVVCTSLGKLGGGRRGELFAEPNRCLNFSIFLVVSNKTSELVGTVLHGSLEVAPDIFAGVAQVSKHCFDVLNVFQTNLN